MGLLLSKLFAVFEGFSQGDPAKVLMLGLDAAGKTTIVYKIKLNKSVCTIPTIGFYVETVTPCKGIRFTVWDVGGQYSVRMLWKHYLTNTEGVVYVVDCSDRERVAEAREELWGVLDADEMRGVPVVIMANKQDLPGAMKPSDVIEVLELRKLVDHQWHVQGTCATNGDGIHESMESLAGLVKKFKQSRR